MDERDTKPVPGYEGLGAPDQWVAKCWTDMRRRWNRRERVRVEDYLPDDYQIAVPQEAVVDLVYAEYILCKEFGGSVNQRDFIERFPQLESALVRQFAIDDALSSDVPCLFDSTLTGSSDETAQQREPLPERIGKYIVVARAGIGGQAEILRAVHPALGKEVVLKLARASDREGPVERERLESEARILARIEHPNLARIYDLDFHEDRPFLVMEFIRGCTLEQYAHQQRPTPRATAALLAKIARGVALAHRCGIAHLDIKPSNVLIDDAGEPRLIDFGLAHLADAWHEEVLEQNSLRGTLHFMAPEQARGEAQSIGFQSDIFAMGGLLYFLLTGSSPYPKNGSFAEVLQRAQNCDWDQEQLYHRHIPPRLRNCCLTAMEGEPQQRFPNADTLARELDKCARSHTKTICLVLTATVALLGIITLAAVGPDWIHFGKQATVPPAVNNSGPPATKQPAYAQSDSEPSLLVHVWDSDRFLELPNVAPARSGDRLRITAQVPASMHYTLISLTSEGEYVEIGRGQTAEEPVLLRYPVSGKAVPLTGPPGTELILICGRASSPLQITELETLGRDGLRLPQLPELSVLRLDHQGVTVEQRGRGLGAPVDLPDPETVVRSRLESLGQALQQRVDFFEAIAFCHR